MSKSLHDAAQQMLDALYGLQAMEGFGALSAATATAVAGYMHNWGKTPEEAEALLEDLHAETVARMHEAWGNVARNDC